MLSKDEFQGKENLLGSYPYFKLSNIPEGLESFDKDVNSLMNNNTSTIPFPYPNFDVAIYFQTSNLQPMELQNVISQLKQEVSTHQTWSKNAEDSNDSRITDLQLVMVNSNPYYNIQTTVWNSVEDVG